MSLGPLAGCITRHYYPLWIEGATLESDFFSARCSNEVQGGHKTYQASASLAHTSKKNWCTGRQPREIYKTVSKVGAGNTEGGDKQHGWEGLATGRELARDGKKGTCSLKASMFCSFRNSKQRSDITFT